MMRTFFIISAIVLLGSCKRELNQRTITQTPPELQFTVHNIIYQFHENITAKEFVRDSLKHIQIDFHKDPSTYQVDIIGTSSQISAGAYPFSVAPSGFAANSSWFFQDEYDYRIIEYDFSLQVVSYENGYLDATFHSSRVSNGIINHLKIEQ